MITNGFTYVAVLLFMAAMLVTLEKSAKGGVAKFFKFIPAVVLCYLISMLLCTFKVWDMAATKPAYSALKNNLTYAMVFAMLLPDFRFSSPISSALTKKKGNEIKVQEF